MERKVRPAKHHPFPHRGVERSRRNSTDQVNPPQPCPPASPSGVVGRPTQQAGPQQLHTPPHWTPLRTAPTWADIARGGDPTHQEAPPRHLQTPSLSISFKSPWAFKLAFRLKVMLAMRTSPSFATWHYIGYWNEVLSNIRYPTSQCKHIVTVA
jgi:hypothetical protein